MIMHFTLSPMVYATFPSQQNETICTKYAIVQTSEESGRNYDKKCLITTFWNNFCTRLLCNKR